MKIPSRLLAASVAVGVAALAAPAGAAPIAAPSALRAAAAPAIQTVQWRGWRGWRGWGWAPGLAAGAIVGGAIAAATQPWNWGYEGYPYAPGYAYPGYAYAYAPGYAYGYGGAPGYVAPTSPGYGYGDTGYTYAYSPGYADYAYAPGVVVSSGRGSSTYCSQRFRSYDPASGTYLGFDGRHHPCR